MSGPSNLGWIDRRAVFGEVAGAVERIAPGFFDEGFVAEHLARYRWAAKFVAGKAVLDVASGTGYGAPILRSAGAREVFSVDIAEAALRFGFARYRLRPVMADACRLPLRDRSVDVVISLETIEHLRDPLVFIGEVARVLRQRGVVALSTPNAAMSTSRNPYHLREFELQELLELLQENGLIPFEISGQRWKLVGPFKTIRGLKRLAFELERIPRVIRHVPLAEARVMCVAARKRRG